MVDMITCKSLLHHTPAVTGLSWSSSTSCEVSTWMDSCIIGMVENGHKVKMVVEVVVVVWKKRIAFTKHMAKIRKQLSLVG